MGEISKKVQESSKNCADMHYIEKRRMMCRYIKIDGLVMDVPLKRRKGTPLPLLHHYVLTIL